MHKISLFPVPTSIKKIYRGALIQKGTSSNRSSFALTLLSEYKNNLPSDFGSNTHGPGQIFPA